MRDEIEIEFEKLRATIGRRGASLRTLTLADWPVIWGYRGTENKKAGQGDVLIPFPSRLKNGRYAFAGQTHQLELNDKEGPNAIHGFLREVDWEIHEHSPSHVTLATEIHPNTFRGYPFQLGVEITYCLNSNGLRTSFLINNGGDVDAPVGAGFHPYFTLDQDPIDRWELSLPATTYLEFENLVPTGRELSLAGTALDYRARKPIGSNRFNFCFCKLERDVEGWALATLNQARGSRRIELRFDGAFNYLVIYSGEAIPAPDTRRAFAIEPLTCATDAFNHPEWGLRVLRPGESFEGCFEIDPRA